MAKTAHSWRFFRAGGVDQVVLADAADLADLHTLDQKLWVALACPVAGVEIDARSLALLDTDADGRIRPKEILAAIAWLKDVLKDVGDLFEPSDEVPLDSISTATPAGKDVLAGAKLILKNLGKADAKSIRLADVSSTETIFTSTKLNGDGIVPPESADDEQTAKDIADVIGIMGSAADRSGKPGIDQARVDGFFDQAASYAAWADAGSTLSPLRGAGDVAAAAAALEAVRAKVSDYFARCRLASFDGRAVAALNPTEAELAALSAQVLEPESNDVAKLPLARIEPGRPLPLGEGVNPAWASRVATFARATVAPVLGGPRTSLTEREWETIASTFEPYAAWASAKPTTDVTKLDHARIVALAKGDARARITDLVTRDAALASESNQIEAVEKLVRCRRDFVELLHNFVNFSQFYGKRKAIFQAGTLYLDARSCELVLPVEDPARHAMLASLSQAYLAYCDCVRRGTTREKRSIVAAFTGGDTDNLMVGRNGVFYDRKGDDWDATITKIIENPISIRQAFWSPYKRFVRLIEEQVAKRAKAADDKANTKLESTAVDVTAVGDKPDDKKDAAAKDAAAKDAAAKETAAKEAASKEEEKGKGIDVGTVAAIGVAVGGIATFFSSILATFLGLGMWMPVGIVALMLAISGPSMLIAWLKLRQRNIGPILDANGWAVNAMARINIPFGAALTGLPTLPAGASRSLQDPFAEKKRPWKLYAFLAFLVILAGFWFFGKVDAYLPEKARAAIVLHRTPEPASATPEKPASATPEKK
jgi:hypothetical protein